MLLLFRGLEGALSPLLEMLTSFYVLYISNKVNLHFFFNNLNFRSQ